MNVFKLQDILSEIQERYMEVLCMFPFNVTQTDLDLHKVELKKVNLAERTMFLSRAITQYWDFGLNRKGPHYSYVLWKELLSYGYKMGPPPT